jgi:hypothetical protein
VKAEISKAVGGGTGVAARGTVFEQTLTGLTPKIAALDFSRVAKDFGAELAAPGRLELVFLNERYTVTHDGVTGPSGAKPHAFISILIINHLCMPSPPPVSGEWITFSAVPASHAKDKSWIAHVEEVIARHYVGNVDGFRRACEQMGGKAADIKGGHDAAYEFRFFPRYPVIVQFFDAVPDEDFPAQCKLLLDRTVDKYLDLESIVVLGEEFAARLTA